MISSQQKLHFDADGNSFIKILQMNFRHQKKKKNTICLLFREEIPEIYSAKEDPVMKSTRLILLSVGFNNEAELPGISIS